jgi:hypothetical protein
MRRGGFVKTLRRLGQMGRRIEPGAGILTKNIANQGARLVNFQLQPTGATPWPVSRSGRPLMNANKKDSAIS